MTYENDRILKNGRGSTRSHCGEMAWKEAKMMM
jgi:hypothetical protein